GIAQRCSGILSKLGKKTSSPPRSQSILNVWRLSIIVDEFPRDLARIERHHRNFRLPVVCRVRCVATVAARLTMPLSDIDFNLLLLSLFAGSFLLALLGMALDG